MKCQTLALAAASMFMVTPFAASAGGVPAGTQIDNTATATFDDGPATKTVQSNTVSLRVDEILDLAITSLSSGPVTLTGSAAAALPFRITNTGNGPEAFSLSLNPTVGGNGFDATANGIAIDSNGNGAYDAGVDQLLAPGADTGELAPDGAITVFALVALPTGTADGATSQVRLTATALTGSGTAGTVFAGAGAAGGAAVVGTSTAQASALSAIIASSFTVSLTKSATISNPFGGSQPVPGSVITYAIAAQVVGSGTATGLRIADAIPSGTTYRAGSLKLQGAALSDANDADAGSATASGINVALGDVSGGTTHSVTFQVTIN